jgi:hypothetical protein
MRQFMQPDPCENLNHRRANAPVRYCPGCGGVVNERVRTQQCSESRHAVERRHGTVFCVDCGTRLISER